MRSSVDRSVFERPAATTLVEMLRATVSAIGDEQAFCFIRDQGKGDVSITYRQLHQRAMAIGAELQSRMLPNQCALLLFPPGLDFIAAFFGCLYAGVVAVPVALPARHRSTSSIEAILEASDPALILSTADHCELAKQLYAHVAPLMARPWIAVDKVADDREGSWRDPQVTGRQIAFLQFTSGSTSSPKGVVLSHENLLNNAALICQAFGNKPDGKGVSWLPAYHDMGLIGGILQPIYCGGLCTLLAPAAFLQRPALWLETISRTGANVSGGPDFAYDLCVRKISAEERERLDLSHWEIAFTGAERVRAETLERFATTFAPCGFRREAFFPCYGLAEATLMVSGGPWQSPPRIVHIRAESLQQHQTQAPSNGDSASRALVGCGECMPGHTIAIVDPQTHVRCKEGSVGEIWVRGPSVAYGYYGQPEATEAAFGGHLNDTGEGPFLRTGDLGFLREGQLFVTGRLKDVIIIRGRNYYPEDIEQTIDGAHRALRAGYCAAFSIEADDQERLVIVQELEPRQRNLDADAALQAIRGAIATHHELEVFAIALVKAGEIPKTSSGKTRRSACRQRYLGGQLQVIAQWKSLDMATQAEAWDTSRAAAMRSVTTAEVEEWLIQRIASRLALPPAQVHVTTPFLEFGMGSVDVVEIAADLERWLGRQIGPTAIYNYPNIAALARWLASPPSDSASSVRRHGAHQATGSPHPEQLLEEVRQMTQEEMEALIQQEMTKQ